MPGASRLDGHSKLQAQALADLTAISDTAARLDVSSPAEDFDVGLTTDDMIR
jgi:hypothetical protein